jgi:hypothetical protein
MSDTSASKTPLKAWLRRIILAVAIILGLFLVMVLYVVLIPPSGTPQHAKRPTIEKVPDAENAWLDYKLAIEEIEQDKALKGLEFSDSSDLTPQQKEVLDRHSKAIEHLLAGAKKPRFQYNSELPSIKTNFLSPITLRNLSNIVIAQAARLEKEGKSSEAIELNLALYHMGSQIAEPYSPIISLLLSKTCRNIADKPLFKNINKGSGEAATYTKIARQIAQDNANAPSAYDVIDWEWQYSSRTIEDSFFNSTSSNDSLDNLPTNIKLRVFKSYMEKQNQILETLKPSLENWDFAGLNETNKKINEMLEDSVNHWYKKPFIGDYVSSVLLSTTVPNYETTIKRLYFDIANANALETLAVVLAYQKAHGNFPETLEPAFQELGLKVPIDPITKKAISYRLENAKPIVWLAGIDGKDDGGKTPYSKDTKTAITGSDLIYPLDQFPIHLNQ